jgi:hypothetical protein
MSQGSHRRAAEVSGAPSKKTGRDWPVMRVIRSELTAPADGAATFVAPLHNEFARLEQLGIQAASVLTVGATPADDWSAAPSAVYLQRLCAYRTGGSLKDRAANAKFPCCT